MISQDKKDKIYNALLIGMALEDSYIYAGLSADEITYVSEDDALQSEWRQLTKAFEFDLLHQINDISKKQAKMGKEAATTWMLEKMFPRYSGKPQGAVGSITLNINNQSEDDECIDFHIHKDGDNTL